MVHKDTKTKKIDLTNNFFSGFLKKPSWGMLLESCTTRFIEVARLENCQKAGELWLEGEERNKISLTHFS